MTPASHSSPGRTLALLCLIGFCAGSIYAWSVLAAAKAEELAAAGAAAGASGLSLAFGIANGIGPIPMIAGGLANDRFGPRPVIIAGALLIGSGLAVCGLAQEAAQVIAGYGILFGLGLGLSYGAVVSTAVRLFPGRRGLASGLVTASYGLSSVLVPPAAQTLIESVGIAGTFFTLGAVFAAVMTACALAADLPGARSAAAGPRSGGLSPREMLRAPEFLPMILVLLTGALAAMMVLSQAASIARDLIGAGAKEAALAVSFIALFNMASRLAAGHLSDRLGRLPVLAGALAAAFAALVLLLFAGRGDYALFLLSGALIGASLGSFMAVYPGLTVDRFGPAHAGVNYGIVFCGFSAAGLLGPVIAGAFGASGAGGRAGTALALAVTAAGFPCLALLSRAIRRSGRPV